MENPAPNQGRRVMSAGRVLAAFVLVMGVILMVMVSGSVLLTLRSGGGGGGGGGQRADLRRQADAKAAAETRRKFAATMTIPEFALTDQDGTAVGREIFARGPAVLLFTFTNCPTACPVMLGRLLPLHADPALNSARFVSISVDPENDTPGALKAHAAKLGVDSARWRFLTGDAGTVRAILASLKLGFGRDAALQVTLPDGRTMDNIDHPSKALLVGDGARVIDFFDALTAEGIDELRSALLAEL